MRRFYKGYEITDVGNGLWLNGKDRSYAKRPVWQWIVIYAIIAVVVYGVIYYFVAYRNTVAAKTAIPQKPSTSTTQPLY